MTSSIPPMSKGLGEDGRTPLRSVPGETEAGGAGQPRFPRDYATDASFCPKCGEPEVDPSVEAFEIFGEAMCADCAAGLFATTPQDAN